MKRKILYIFVVLILFFINVGNVGAVTAQRGTWFFKGQKEETFYKTIRLDNGSTKVAYCANKHRRAPKTDGVMQSLGNTWKNSNSCYYGDIKSENKVDCSIMAGYVLQIASTYAGGNLYDASNYVFTQKAIQTFLKNSTDWAAYNDYFYKASVTNKDASSKYYGKTFTVNDVIREAKKKYDAYVSALKNSNNSINWIEVSEPVITSEFVYSSDGKKQDISMYYKGGYYRSYKINVESNKPTICTVDKCEFKLRLTTNSTNAKICKSSDAAWDSDDCQYELSFNDDVNEVYLITSGTDSVTLYANSSYEQFKNSDSVTYADSDMYEYQVKNKKDFQLLVVLESSSENTDSFSKTTYGEALSTFVVKPVSTGDCNTLYKGYNDKNKKETGVICENNNSENNSKNDVSFKGCVKETREIDLNVNKVYYKNSANQCKQVGSVTTEIVIGQEGKFHFGELVGDTTPIIRGQGFSLKNVYYTNYISWMYAIKYGSNDNVYFQLSNGYGNVHHDSLVYLDSSCVNSTKKNLDEYLKDKIAQLSVSSSSNLEEISNRFFKTYTDNVYTTNNNKDNMKVVPVILKKSEKQSDSSVEYLESLDDKISSNKWYVSSYVFQAPAAFIEVLDNDVVYVSSDSDINTKNLDKKYVYSGYRYYTLLKFVGDRFPLNSNPDVNVSFVNGMNWNIDASCDVVICSDEDCPPPIICDDISKKCVFNYDYRPIDLDNPFPKVVASNWTKEADQKRLNSSIFNKTPDYTIVLNDSNLSKINDDGTSYPVFDKISKDGSSSFVTDFFNGNINAVKSKNYCALGEFSSKCDVQR